MLSAAGVRAQEADASEPATFAQRVPSAGARSSQRRAPALRAMSGVPQPARLRRSASAGAATRSSDFRRLRRNVSKDVCAASVATRVADSYSCDARTDGGGQVGYAAQAAGRSIAMPMKRTAPSGSVEARRAMSRVAGACGSRSQAARSSAARTSGEREMPFSARRSRGRRRAPGRRAPSGRRARRGRARRSSAPAGPRRRGACSSSGSAFLGLAAAIASAACQRSWAVAPWRASTLAR